MTDLEREAFETTCGGMLGYQTKRVALMRNDDGDYEIEVTRIAWRVFQARAKAQQWRPIDTAPRDGARVLLLGAASVPERVEWLAGLQFVGRRCTSDVVAWSFAAPVGMGGIPDTWLAGWMPLPPIPAAPEVAHG